MELFSSSKVANKNVVLFLFSDRYFVWCEECGAGGRIRMAGGVFHYTVDVGVARFYLLTRNVLYTFN